METEWLIDLSEKTVKHALGAGADQVQASAFYHDMSLTRFANSQIHQNIEAKEGGVSVKVILDKSICSIDVKSLNEKMVWPAIDEGVKIAKMMPPNTDFKSLPKPEKWIPIPGAYDEETATCSPVQRASYVDELIRMAHSFSPLVDSVAGFCSLSAMGFAVCNSLGVSAYERLTMASLSSTVISKRGESLGFGFDQTVSRRVRDFNPASIGKVAAESSVNSLNPIKLAPGEYEVVLSPLAVATLISSIANGFSATSWQNGSSFVKHNMNKQVFDEKLTVVDDVRDPKTVLAMPVDGEGVPKRRIKLITKGVVGEGSIVYDSLTASKDGKETTGHSPLPWRREFRAGEPRPTNMVMSSGDSKIEEMIEDTKRGILITTFHYNALVNKTRILISGLTRNGTFLVEDGAVTKPVMNLRYTDSMLSALKEIPLIGDRLEKTETIVVPALKLNKLRFTGVTEY